MSRRIQLTTNTDDEKQELIEYGKARHFKNTGEFLIHAAFNYISRNKLQKHGAVARPALKRVLDDLAENIKELYARIERLEAKND